MASPRSIVFVQLLALSGSGCRPAVARVDPVVRDYMAMCPEGIRSGAVCAQPSATCSSQFNQCGASPVATSAVDPSQPPVPPRCSQHRTSCECVSVQGSSSPTWSCRSALEHPAGPQPPPELAVFA
ncbi:MAG: hypothetical protein U0269_37545 [Polyangiales bacterium]